MDYWRRHVPKNRYFHSHQRLELGIRLSRGLTPRNGLIYCFQIGSPPTSPVWRSVKATARLLPFFLRNTSPDVAVHVPMIPPSIVRPKAVPLDGAIAPLS